DIAPLPPVDIAVPEIKRRVARINRALMPGAENVADLVSDRIGDHRAGMVHDEVGLFGVRGNARGKAATRRIVYDQADDVASLLVAKFVDLAERTDPVDHWVEMLKLFPTCFVIVNRLGVYEPQANIMQTTVDERKVDLLDGDLDELRKVDEVMARRPCGV